MGSQNSTISHQPEPHPSGIPGLSTANQESDVIPSIQQRSFFGNQQRLLSPVLDREEKLPDDVVTCVFTWRQTGAHMGLEVFLTGSFCNWQVLPSHRLIRTGHDFVIVLDLPRGVHTYKFIVDGQWSYSPHHSTISDDRGNVNNILDISCYHRERYGFLTEVEQALSSEFTQNTSHPPPSDLSQPLSFPPLLQKCTCVAAHSQQRQGVPLHCICNHVYQDSVAPKAFGAHVAALAVTVSFPKYDGEDLRKRHVSYTYVTINRGSPPPKLSRWHFDFNLPSGLHSLENLIFFSKNKK